ncbi:MAG TPA: lipid A biosynthesis acyltransferase [Gallionellaceae bacterium]|nr:lipid A biosynthesis acyltransferase [Gallionellaceae bacterium]
MMARLGVFLLWLLHFLPLRVLGWIGNTLGMLLYALARERRMVAAINLRLCFPHKSETERALIVRRHFRAFGRSVLERSILWWSSPARLERLIKVRGLEHFEEACKRPTILITAHFVALDVGGSWLSRHIDVVSIYSRQKNPYMQDLVLRMRKRFGKQVLYSRQEGMRPVIKALREGHPFYYFIDQDLTVKDGMFVPFFGVQAATLSTLPRLAEMARAQVVPCITRVLPDYQGYEVTFYPPWENYPSGDAEADTRRINEFVEQRVLEMPEQYFWVHKRFKTRPEGERSFYE